MPHTFTQKKQTDRFQPMSSQIAILPGSADPHAEYQFPTTPDIDRWLSEENTFQTHQDDFDWLEGNVDPGDFPPSDQQNINQNDRQGLVRNTIEGETKVFSNNERESMGRKSHEGTHPYTDDRLIHGHGRTKKSLGTYSLT